MTPGEGLELPRSSGEGPAAGVGVRQVLRGRKAHTPRWGRRLVLRNCAPEQSGTGGWEVGRGGVEFHMGEEPRGRGWIQGASGCAKSGEQGGKSRRRFVRT